MSSPSAIRRVAKLGTLVAGLLIAPCQDAIAQRLACVTIRSGETASDVAARITGAANHVRDPWFQIVDPTTSRVVPKSSYDRVPSGWRACVVNAAIIRAAVPMSVASSPKQRGQTVRDLDPTVALWGMLLASIALMIRSGHRYLGQRAVVIKRMRRFGDRFVREFEQPLTQRDRIDRPIQSRLRFAPSRARFDVLLAPNAGRRYPNLADHKNNVEYDVTRVLQLLKDQSFVGGQPYAYGRWVVVPFQLKPGPRQAGGT